ncbi:cell division protein FtsK [Corynebacterium phocae]|uniref:Cell division protein FtsK n=1 Tax=Corynebacterium phocae TaxID=161895 RepID=A0A1L7D4Z5_9CORY|nr:type VII secretion protein EccCa [Corynebacterium phocae]APT93209.1 cell division protein FtsK [Corynebacterium phocae]KAA8721947.1 type VII secretion protein EccCa [Corynebacterium phocae]
MTNFVVEPVTAKTREPAPPLPTGSLFAEKIPEAQRPKPVPLIRLAMPIVMVVAVLGMVALMVIGGGQRQFNPMMMMFPLMMLMSVATMFGGQAGGEEPDEVRRTYLRHLRELGNKARDHGRSQRAHELHRHPLLIHLPAIISSRRLWERAAGDPDAMEVRIGTGTVSLATPIEVPESGAPEDLDPVCAVSVRHMIHAVGQLPDMPVVIQLQAFRFLALGGPRARDLARAMVIHLAVAHGPETVGFTVIGSEWEWLKWLPHTRAPEAARYHVLIVDSLATTGLEEFVDDPAYSTIIDVGALRTTALGIRAEHEGLFLVVDQDVSVLTQQGEEKLGEADCLGAVETLTLARRLAPFVRPAGAVASRNRDGDLLGLLGVRDTQELASKLWPGRTGAARLNVPVGVDADGLPVNLDIKESAQGGAGPHGLCIGATGSGKSELLRTLVISLAATHSPDELNFVLVDFKGGATFLGCETLPHTSAVITNLEEESVLVDRMFDAISGELNRRQSVLRKAGNFANVTDYEAGRDKEVWPPMPALVIVIDEFSELLGQHPDFADLFVAVGRLGRSLHVHLLLASQRLEEGRLRGLDSHLSYRFGLKTFSAAESRQVLGITDAYSLPSKPGAGFLKAGSDNLVRLQASYVSGPLRRQVGAPGAAPGGCVQEFIWHDPQVPEHEDEIIIDTSTTLLDSVVDIARAEATKRGQSAHKLWLPPLPQVVELPDVLPAAVADSPATAPDLQVALGLVDRPYQQRQDPLTVDLGTKGGHLALCGGPQSGKSTAVRTLVCSLAAGHSPQKVRFYIVDLGGGQLFTLERLPHVAGVAGRGQPEKVRRIIDEVTTILHDAEEEAATGTATGTAMGPEVEAGLGAEAGVGSGAEAGFGAGAEAESGAGAGQQWQTFVIIDGWHHIGTAGADFEDLADPVTHLAADGASAGIHLVVSTARWTTMRPAIRDLIAHRLELKLGESMDSLIDRKAQEKLPGLPGRGLNQAAEPMLIARSSNQDLAHIVSVWEDQGVAPAPPLRMLANHLSLHELVHRAGVVPVGTGGKRLEQVDWDPRHNQHFVCIGSNSAGKSQALATLMAGICQLGRNKARLVIVDQRRAHLGKIPADMVASYAGQTSAAEQALRQAATTLRERLPGPEITPEQLARRDWWQGPELFVVIDDLDVVADMAVHPLIELLPHAADIGLHLVVARKSGGISRALFSGFLAALRDQQPSVLLLDADKDEGPIFGIKPTPQPPGRGHLSQRGKPPQLIQVATHMDASMSVPVSTSAPTSAGLVTADTAEGQNIHE